MLSRMPPVALDISPYHFACDGEIFGIPHFWNLLTNVPLLLLGVHGLRRARKLARDGRAVSFNWIGIWISTIAIGLGSIAYHGWLTPWGLALDRIAISGLIAFFLAHTADVALGIGPSRRLSFGLLVACQATVLVWILGGTAWIYGVLQAVGGVAVLAVFVRGGWRARRGLGPLSVSPRPVYLFALCYGLAKLFELYDEPVCELTGFLGGHPIKHVFSALGILAFGRMMTAPRAVAASLAREI